MNGENTNIPGGDESGLELLMAASAAERANRPRTLVVLAGLVLLAAIGYAVLGVSSRSAAAGAVESELRQTAELTRVAERIRALQAAQALRGLEPNSRIGKEIEDLAAEEGLTADPAGRKLVIGESEVSGQAVPGVAQRKYTAKMTGQDAAAILRWLNNVQTSDRTRGVEISALNLKPEPQGTRGAWNVDVEFVRWERRP
jgi:type II secretory pathway component PulM